MCDTCSSHIPGPAAAVSGLADVVGTVVQYAWRPFFVLLGAAFVYAHFWWLLGLSAVAGVALWAVLRVLHRHVIVQVPQSTPQMRAALAARGLKAIPVAGQARPALPRGLSITRRRALPAPAKALPEAVVTGVVVKAPRSR